MTIQIKELTIKADISDSKDYDTSYQNYQQEKQDGKKQDSDIQKVISLNKKIKENRER